MVSAVSVSLSAPRNAHMSTRSSSFRSVSSTPTASTTAAALQRRRPHSTGPLKGVVAMVDVRVGADAQIDCSDVVARKLRELGASTVKRLTPKLTHMVLSHLSPVWKTKIAKWQAGGGSMDATATRYDLKIVSQLWVNACYVSKKMMDERPFFPVSQQSSVENVVKAKPKLKRRQSLGTEAVKGIEEQKDQDKKAADAGDVIDVAKVTVPSTPPTSICETNKTQNGGKKKRRALSMEPMTSDAILKMLGTTDPMPVVVEIGTPKQPVQSKNLSSSAKRRKTLNGPPTRQDEDEVTVSQASEFVAESESENEKEDEIKPKSNDVIVILESQASQASEASPNVLKKDNSPVILTDTSTTPTMTNGEFSTPDERVHKKGSARLEVRRRNRTSLSYGNGLTLKSGIWSCAACGCSNPRTRGQCTDCQASRGSAKSPSADNTDLASPATIACTVADLPKTPASPPATTLVLATPETKTPAPSNRIRTPTSANRSITPISSPSVLGRTPCTLTRPTASSAAKTRTPSPAASRAPRTATKTFTPSPAPRPSPAARSSTSTKQTARSSLASASVSIDVQVQKLPVKKLQRKQPTMTDLPSAMKSTQSAAKKRARPPVSSNTLTTPVVKKVRRDSNKANTVNRHSSLATPGSVSGFLRKHRDVSSTPIPMAMDFSSTTSRKTPRKTPRNVIGITGVSAETRRVLQCAIHAIDANMTNDSGYRKARVVKSVDYAAGVTHLIVGKDARRTIKVLFAIARGAWIVSEDWAFSSLDQERWLPEEDYELTMFANKYAREHPEARHIFKGMKVFVGSKVDPSREVLQSLVQVAGGEICNQTSVANLCICGDTSLFRRAQRTGIRVVTSKWVFDSIAAMKLEDDAKYSFTDLVGTPANTPLKSRSVAASGLEAHSTVPE